jgi:hypothetical protein
MADSSRVSAAPIPNGIASQRSIASFEVTRPTPPDSRASVIPGTK